MWKKYSMSAQYKKITRKTKKQKQYNMMRKKKSSIKTKQELRQMLQLTDKAIKTTITAKPVWFSG